MFSQFPAQEYAWNFADEILLGNMAVDPHSHNVRAKVTRTPLATPLSLSHGSLSRLSLGHTALAQRARQGTDNTL